MKSPTNIEVMKTISSHRGATRSTKAHRAGSSAGQGNGHAGVRHNGHTTTPEVAAWLAKPKHNLINGRWVPAASGKMFNVLNPADASLLTEVPDSDREDINRAVTAARKAFEAGPWRRM